MKPREFHIWDFPEDRVRILMENDMQSKFFEDCKRKFGSFRKYSKFLSISYGTVQGWRRCRLFIPLWAVKKTLPIISWNWENVEGNIVAYKGINTSLPILDPILPVKEVPELFETIAHLIGDGSVNKNGIPYYVNSKLELVEHLKNAIIRTFGKVHTKLHKRHEKYEFTFSKIVPDLIRHFYDVKFDSYNAKLPGEVFELPYEFGISCVRAIVDDEGCVRDNRIIISMKSKTIVNQIRQLLIRIIGSENITSLSSRKSGQWVVALKSSGMEKFENRIKLIHPEKRKDLSYAIKKSKVRLIEVGDPVWDTKIRILKFLKDCNLTPKKISREFFINQDNINIHLKQLSKKNLVKRIRRQKYSYIWSITSDGLKFLEKNTQNWEDIEIKTIDWRREFNLSDKQFRILLNKNGRERLFWMLERIFNNQNEMDTFFGVHRNTISDWKNGKNSLPLPTLDRMVGFLNSHGIDIVNDIKVNVKEIRYKNGKLKMYVGN